MGKSDLKLLLFLTGLFFMCGARGAALQDDLCTPPIVAVLRSGILDEAIEHLNQQYGPQPEDVWLTQIQAKVMEELRRNSPGTIFVAAVGSAPEECDYYIDYSISLIGAGKIIEIGGVKTSEYTAYLMTSNLYTISRCGIPGRRMDTEITSDNRDIFRTIELNIAGHGNIGDRIKEYEQSHPVPPRGPVMSAELEPDAVSPLEEERELNIRIKVKNCRGEDVYDKPKGQRVILPRKTDRGMFRPTKGFPQGVEVTDTSVTLILITPEGGSATYTLEKGVEPGLETIAIQTCGREKSVTLESEIRISGLEIDVKPLKRSLGPGESTQVEIEFVKVDTHGQKEPVPGKALWIEVDGLEDGEVTPIGDVKTDEEGKAFLTYYAGDKDEKISIEAEYRPKDFSDVVKGEAGIRVYKEAVWTGTVTYRRNFDKTTEEQGPSGATVKLREIVTEVANFVVHGWPFSHSYDSDEGTDLYYEGDDSSLTGSYSGTLVKIRTIQTSEGPSRITDSATCQFRMKDSGYLVINNERLEASLGLGLSMNGDEDCEGQTEYVGVNSSFTTDYDWANQYQLAGAGFLESKITTKDPQTISGSLTIPNLSITWTWNLSLSRK